MGRRLVAGILPVIVLGLPASARTVRVRTSEDVVRIPAPLVFVDALGATHEVILNGNVPGNVFLGPLNGELPAGQGEFKLGNQSLVDRAGNSGSEIVSGRYYTVPSTTPPPSPDFTIIIYPDGTIWTSG